MILLMSLVSLAQAECLEPRNARDLSEVISQMESYFVAMDIGGYFQPNEEKAAAAMRPSQLFNDELAKFS
mgnify:CR=1 FL=1